MPLDDTNDDDVVVFVVLDFDLLVEDSDGFFFFALLGDFRCCVLIAFVSSPAVSMTSFELLSVVLSNKEGSDSKLSKATTAITNTRRILRPFDTCCVLRRRCCCSGHIL